jgi:anthranilate synthase component 2
MKLGTPKLLILDNYDSFTFNLVQYLAELGAEVEVVRNDALTVDQALERRPDAFVVSPGPCTPAEAGISVELIRRASGRVPILGVCLGHQSLCVAFGGRVVRAGVIMHGKTSPIDHDGEGLFAGIERPFEATRYHSLVAEPASLPACLRVTAWTQDPDGRTIMGLRHTEHPATFGVQFHPESILTRAGKPILANFLGMLTQ